MYNYDLCVVDSEFLLKPPRRYDCWLEQDDGILFEHIKSSRILAVEDMDWPEIDRLIDLEDSLRIRTKRLKRNFEEEL